MPQTRFEIEARGARTAAHNLRQVGDRLSDAKPAFAEVINILEVAETRHFVRLRGRYIRTGDLLESLTQARGNGKIRQVHVDGGGLTFGTDIFYARFQNKRRKEPEDGQVKKKRGKGKSAVLVFQPKTKKAATQILLDYAVGPVR